MERICNIKESSWKNKGFKQFFKCREYKRQHKLLQLRGLCSWSWKADSKNCWCYLSPGMGAALLATSGPALVLHAWSVSSNSMPVTSLLVLTVAFYPPAMFTHIGCMVMECPCYMKSYWLLWLFGQGLCWLRIAPYSGEEGDKFKPRN